MCAVGSPTLVIVSGPAGTGKTTLAHRLARSLGCPAICRDEIKEGMVHSEPGFTPATGDLLTQRTVVVFFDVVRLLVERGVTVVAEAAFQDHIWAPNLASMTGLAELRVVQCHADAAVAWQRIAARAESRAAHADTALRAAYESGEGYFEAFRRLAIEAPSIDVDTTAGYDPPIDEVVALLEAR
jgi:predicted kinase